MNIPGNPFPAHYTKRSLIAIIAATIAGTIVLFFGFKALVDEGKRVEEGIDAGDSPLWNTVH